MDAREIAMRALQANPKFQQSPMGQQFMQILNNNDETAGIQMANNIMKTYGLSKEQATQQASDGIRGLFHL